MWYGIAIVIVGLGYYGIPWLCSKIMKGQLQKKARRQRSLVLTFDDVPGSVLTPAILQLLKKHDVKATFFVLGRNIKTNEHLLRQAANEGHELATHGYDHFDYWRISPFRSVRDIRQGFQALNQTLGSQSKSCLFRPPYGRLNLISLIYLWMQKIPVIYWTLDSKDTHAYEVRDSDAVIQELRFRQGAVALLHDFDREDTVSSPYVCEVTDKLIRLAQEEQMTITTIHDL